jgi:nucleotide-binding universal stress UspA family protein
LEHLDRIDRRPLMFRSLLVPLDGSAQAAAALPLARTIAQATGGSITLLRVPLSHAVSDCQQATSYLEAAAEELRHANLSVHTFCRPGEPAREILAVARSQANDLIVMCSRALGPRSITTLTSVARFVLANSPAPLLLVRPDGISTTHLRTLLVPVDGSPGGSIALGVATALAGPTGAKIVLLNVVVPVPAAAYAALPGMTLGGFIDPAWEQEALVSVRSYIDKIARHLRDAGLTAETHVAVGQVQTEIVRCADTVDADVVLMGTHALRWPGQANVGSVADGVLRCGRRPVLMVRREPPAGDTGPVFESASFAWSTS